MIHGPASERRELRRQLIAEQEKSGESVRAFCKRQEIAEHAFYAWRKRLRTDKPLAFALVETKPAPKEEAASIELVLSQGDRLRIPCDKTMLRMVLSALRERP